MHQADVFSLKGTRRVERHYANRTVYETGLVLEEKIFDLSAPIAGTEPAPRGTVPQRWKRNAYILVDTALSNADRFICERIRTPGPADDLDILASDLLKVRTFGAFSVGDHGIANCRQNLVSGQSADDPSFDSVARRLNSCTRPDRQPKPGRNLWAGIGARQRAASPGRQFCAGDQRLRAW